RSCCSRATTSWACSCRCRTRGASRGATSRSARPSSDVLIGAIAAAADGEVVIDPTLVRRSQPRAGTEVAGLTPAQFGVLRLVAEGPVERGRRRAPAHHRAVGREPPAVDLPTLRQWGADLDELRE